MCDTFVLIYGAASAALRNGVCFQSTLVTRLTVHDVTHGQLGISSCLRQGTRSYLVLRSIRCCLDQNPRRGLRLHLTKRPVWLARFLLSCLRSPRLCFSRQPLSLGTRDPSCAAIPSDPLICGDSRQYRMLRGAQATTLASGGTSSCFS